MACSAENKPAGVHSEEKPSKFLAGTEAVIAEGEQKKVRNQTALFTFSILNDCTENSSAK